MAWWFADDWEVWFCDGTYMLRDFGKLFCPSHGRMSALAFRSFIGCNAAVCSGEGELPCAMRTAEIASDAGL